MRNLIANLRYLNYVLRHKWFVLYAGRKLVGGIALRQLLVHDMSKFSEAEWGPYVRRFYGGRSNEMDHSGDRDEFHRAFRHHWHHNPHHWEYWVERRAGISTASKMPEKYAREMVADWMGAGRAKTGQWEVHEWYAKNRDRMKLHPDTRQYVERLLRYTAYEDYYGPGRGLD